jgi:hypothetical protein
MTQPSNSFALVKSIRLHQRKFREDCHEVAYLTYQSKTLEVGIFEPMANLKVRSCAPNWVPFPNKGEKMKAFTLIFSLLMAASGFAFAEEHASAALEHANAAVTHGKAGHAPVLVEHATTALEHAKAGAVVAKGDAKGHMNEGVKHLEEAVKHGKMNHADVATKHAEEAVEHIKAGNQ